MPLDLLHRHDGAGAEGEGCRVRLPVGPLALSHHIVGRGHEVNRRGDAHAYRLGEDPVLVEGARYGGFEGTAQRALWECRGIHLARRRRRRRRLVSRLAARPTAATHKRSCGARRWRLARRANGGGGSGGRAAGGEVRRMVVEGAHPVDPLAARLALDPILLLRVLGRLRVEITTASDLHLDEGREWQRALAHADGGTRVESDGRAAARRLRRAPGSRSLDARLLMARGAQLGGRNARTKRLGHVGSPFPIRTHRMLERAPTGAAVARRPLHLESVLAAARVRAAQPK